ncbi:PTS lactose/cellobiose transporter subunit IIA [uncultured Helcococcus sp.]|uniref:PTS lactose/cellobiose transporter subunit IIA n=1 Tax=uncultured Helcococcus sp. TaxID=1072508 RepID=UPI00261966AE|nr:PTS lactose/cellobiose transporter subunit IIA [uncultured Helcococcus sp.]
MKYEEDITLLISNSGNAKSLAMEAINEAANGNFDKADEYIEEAKESFLEAHKIQTKLIGQEMTGQPVEISLLMVHAQDHLMNSLTTRDLAVQIINLYKKLEEGRK